MPRHCFNVGTSSRATISVMPLKVVALVGASFLTRWALWLYHESSKHYITAQIRYLSKFGKETFFTVSYVRRNFFHRKRAAMLSVIDRVPLTISFIDAWNLFDCRGNSRVWRRLMMNEMSRGTSSHCQALVSFLSKIYSILEHLKNNIYIINIRRIIYKQDIYTNIAITLSLSMRRVRKRITSGR